MAGSEQHYIMPRAEFDRPVKLLIVVSPYYKAIADNMVAGAVAEIEACGGSYELVEVPGALEIPTAISMAGRMSNFDGMLRWDASFAVKPPTMTRSATTARARFNCWVFRAIASAMAS